MSSSVASAMAPGQEDPDSDTGTVVCPNCGAERTNPAAMFCQECGTRYNS